MCRCVLHVWRLLTTHYNDSSTASMTAESTLDSKEAREVSFASPTGPDQCRVLHSLLPKRIGDSLTRKSIRKVWARTPRLRKGGVIPPRSVWRGMPDCSPAHIFTQKARTHTKLCCRITTLTFTFLTNFKISNFNKEHTSSLKMIWIRSKHVGAFLSVLMWTF